ASSADSTVWRSAAQAPRMSTVLRKKSNSKTRSRSSKTRSRKQTDRPKVEDASVPNQILVQPGRNPGDGMKDLILRRTHANSIQAVRKPDERRCELVLLTFPQRGSFASMTAGLRGLKGVSFFQRNWTYRLQQTTIDDPYFQDGSQWGVYAEPRNTFGCH